MHGLNPSVFSPKTFWWVTFYHLNKCDSTVNKTKNTCIKSKLNRYWWYNIGVCVNSLYWVSLLSSDFSKKIKRTLYLITIIIRAFFIIRIKSKFPSLFFLLWIELHSVFGASLVAAVFTDCFSVHSFGFQTISHNAAKALPRNHSNHRWHLMRIRIFVRVKLFPIRSKQIPAFPFLSRFGGCRFPNLYLTAFYGTDYFIIAEILPTRRRSR